MRNWPLICRAAVPIALEELILLVAGSNKLSGRTEGPSQSKPDHSIRLILFEGF